VSTDAASDSQQAFGLVFDSTSQTSTAGIPRAGSPTHWLREAAVDWSQTTLGFASFGQLGKFLKPLVENLGWGKVRPAWQRYLKNTEARFLSPAAFARNPKPWLESKVKAPQYQHTPRDTTPTSPINVARLRSMVGP